MAEGLFNALAPAGWRAGSAGTDPGIEIRPEAVAVMREAGIDISRQVPKTMAAALGSGAELVVGLCAEEACPVVPGARSLHWPLPNPAGQGIERFREVRDELSGRIRALIGDLTGEGA
jgi:protein-tyrosine-phosphatase